MHQPALGFSTGTKLNFGALVAECSLKRNSQHADRFDVRIINDKDYPFFGAREGQLYLRQGTNRKLLHNTKRQPQPWKTGPPIDFRPREKLRLFPPKGWLKRARRTVFGEYAMLGNYEPHPGAEQERLFLGLLRECRDRGMISEQFLRDEMLRNYVRHDVLEVLERSLPQPAA